MWLIALKKCRDVSAIINSFCEVCNSQLTQIFRQNWAQMRPNQNATMLENLVHGIEGRLVYKR